MRPLTKRSTFSTETRRRRSSLRLLQFVHRELQAGPLHERRLADRLADLGELVGDVRDVDPLVVADAGLLGELEGAAHAGEGHRFERLADRVGLGHLPILVWFEAEE